MGEGATPEELPAVSEAPAPASSGTSPVLPVVIVLVVVVVVVAVVGFLRGNRKANNR